MPYILIALTAAAYLIMAHSSAYAIEPGDYECAVERALGVSMEGETIALNDAPDSFNLNASNAQIHPQELGETPHHKLNVAPESGRRVSARIDETLFAEPATDLRSTDGYVYMQGGVVLQFDGDGRFVAHGPAYFGDPQKTGVAVYAGVCSRR